MVAVATGRLPGNARAGPALPLPRHGAAGLGRAVAAVTAIPLGAGNGEPGPAVVSGVAPVAGDTPGPRIFLWKPGSDEAAGSRGGAARLFWSSMGCWGNTVP